MDELIAGLFILTINDSKSSTSKTQTRVPLKNIAVQVSVVHTAAQVSICQQYVNEDTNIIEAVYRFPIDEQAAVCGFEAEIGDRKVVGVVKAKEEAKEQYKEALAQGHGAYLLEQASADVFEMQVGNIPAHTRVVVTIRYATQLTWSGDKLRFFIPGTIVPRYGHGLSALTKPSGSSVEEPSYTLDVQMKFQMLSPIVSLTSSLPVDVTITKLIAGVKLSSPVGLSTDFDVLISLQDPHTPCVAIEYDEDKHSYALLLSFVPSLAVTTKINTEVILVIDRSGSMQGAPMMQAKATLTSLVNALPEGVYFNIIGFGSRFEMLFAHSELRSKVKIEEALTAIAKMDADFGGTELLAPLRAVFATEPQSHCSRQLMVLTDGAVSNSGDVLDEVRRASVSTRVFTFGIGSGVSRELVNGMARAGGGAAEFILDLKRLKEQVLLQFKRALQPSITALQFDWQGLEVQAFPFVPRPLFHLDPTQVLLFLPTAEEKLYHFSLSGQLPSGQSIKFALPADLRSAARGKVIHSLVAREAIRDLEEGASYLHYRSPKSTDAQIKTEIIRLGLSYNMASSHTSFLAIEERGEEKQAQTLSKKPKRVDVPQYQSVGRTGAAPSRGRTRQKQFLDNLRLVKKRKVVITTPTFPSDTTKCDVGASSKPVRSVSSKRTKMRFRQQTYVQTPFGFQVASTTPSYLTYGDKNKAWSPALSHGFSGPRGHKHLCWLTSSIALVMTVVPWRDALLHLSTRRDLLLSRTKEKEEDIDRDPKNDCNKRGLELLVKALSNVVKKWYALSDRRNNSNNKDLVRSKREMSDAMEQVIQVFEKMYGLTLGEDYSVLKCVCLITSALKECLSPRLMSTVQLYTLGAAEPDIARYSSKEISPSVRYLVFLNPGCALLPSIEQSGFTLRSFLGLEKFVRPVVLEHCICLATQGQSDTLWMFDDNLNGGQGFQGGLISSELMTGVMQHYQERVPVLVYSKNE